MNPLDIIGISLKAKYRSRKRVRGKWVYDYGDGGKKPSSDRKKEILKEGRKLKKEKNRLWDKYFGEHVLTEKWHPNAKRGTNDPKDKAKLQEVMKKYKKLSDEWDKAGYGKK